MTERRHRRVLVTGATGFVGSALVPALVTAGYEVRATTRSLERASPMPKVEWVECDLADRLAIDRAMDGVDAAFFLVHGMGGRSHDFAATERLWALNMRAAATRAGLERIIYLGGVAPATDPSEHLKSRLDVGELLRGGAVPALELRASMIIGSGSASWQIVRDLAMRLPAMILPAWTSSRTRPIALEDVVVALVRGLELPLAESAWYDIPGPDTVSGRELLSTIAALRGRRVPGLPVPFLSVSLSSWWLKLVTRADFSLARELVLGFKGDLLPKDDRYWSEIHYAPRWGVEAAARKALDDEALAPPIPGGTAAKLEEAFVHLLSPKLAH
jgi:uncharacterized protein YbjT (DUF2867 family)